VISFGKVAEIELASRVSIEKLRTADNQFELFKKIHRQYERSFILESLIGPRELAEMSIIGFDPEVIVICDTKRFTVRNRKGKILYRCNAKDPLSQLRNLMPKIDDNYFRFIGGAVGYISYDAIRFWERLPPRSTKRKSNFPLFEFGIYLDGILYNHLENQAYYISLGKSRLAEIENKLSLTTKRGSSFSYSTPRRSISRPRFVKMVKRAKKYIYNGDIFQVVLAKSINFEIKGNLISFYQSLREVNPSPYMYMLKMSDRCIIGSSPEMLVRVTGRHVETFPIAGTRPVVEDEKINERLRQDLLTDEKELAEHTMLVDLARNDMGRVCEFGTVQAKELMVVKRFSHVQHIVSHVIGMLKDGNDSYDALRSVFPAGTVSGAPKVRAMEIIDELETTMRGPYAGALGYFSFNGCCDFAITIRSLFVSKNKAYVESGAGIVMDSDPNLEWAETEQKANALLSALKKVSKVK
jgi:anthranilate synthase component 1